jgi:hypothetical protein
VECDKGDRYGAGFNNEFDVSGSGSPRCTDILTNNLLRVNAHSCKFNHDIKKYLDAKDKDIGDRCVNFENTGE